MKINTIVTHGWPHLDEVLAYFLLRRYGENIFPGVSTARVAFWFYGGNTPNGTSADAWLRKGWLLLGVGYGPLDEHPCPERWIPRKVGESTSSLVAKALGFGPLNKSVLGRAVNHLVAQVTKEDLTGGNGSLLNIEQTLSAMSRQGRSSESMIDDFGMIAVGALLGDRIEFYRERDRATDGTLYNHSFVGRFCLALVISGSPHACKVARCRGAHLVVRHNPETNHVTIMKDHATPIPMGVIVASLRRAEWLALGKPIPPDDQFWDDEGLLAGWFYHEKTGLITTGGDRGARLTKPSILPLGEIERIVISVIS